MTTKVENNKPYCYQPRDIKKYEYRTYAAVATLVAAIILGSVLASEALKCHEQVKDTWEDVMINRTLGLSNTKLYAKINQLIHQGWGYLGGVVTSAVIGVGGLGFGVHALVHKEKAKTQMETRQQLEGMEL